MKTKRQIKYNRLLRRSNDWVLNVLCYPINYIERKVKRLRNKDKEVYLWGKPQRYY